MRKSFRVVRACAQSGLVAKDDFLMPRMIRMIRMITHTPTPPTPTPNPQPHPIPPHPTARDTHLGRGCSAGSCTRNRFPFRFTISPLPRFYNSEDIVKTCYRETVQKNGNRLHVQLPALHPFLNGCDSLFLNRLPTRL